MTLHVDNIWHSYLLFFVKKIFLDTRYAKHYYFWQPAKANFLPNITIPQVHLTYICVYSAIHTSKMLLTHQFTHQTLKIFDSINVLFRSNYINTFLNFNSFQMIMN